MFGFGESNNDCSDDNADKAAQALDQGQAAKARQALFACVDDDDSTIEDVKEIGFLDNVMSKVHSNGKLGLITNFSFAGGYMKNGFGIFTKGSDPK